jgi:hypothetical protein
MAQWHGYFAVERLNVGDAAWSAVKTALAGILIDNPKGPHEMIQIRIRIDDDAGIVEALFTTDTITINAFKTMLSNATGVDVESIDHTVSQVTFAEMPTRIYTFSTSGINRLRAAFFGDTGDFSAAWEQSRCECVQYLINNAAAWEIVT